ncbi:hypothetical protein UPYG_G00251900 [Umbra pygmaea]|uniref:Uncharacterized protein n=1 Tax=Umbra pygmaea TaxID=75934 RepID=A0ABD0W837_UMBPY
MTSTTDCSHLLPWEREPSANCATEKGTRKQQEQSARERVYHSGFRMSGSREEERRKLADIINHWNANRLDLFEISQPTEAYHVHEDAFPSIERFSV